MTECISVIISGFSLVVAVLALTISWRTARRQLQIEETRESDRKIREKKADLIAYIKRETIHRGTSSAEQYFLYLENKGLCEARNINLTIDGQKITEHRCFLKGTAEIRQLGPGATGEYLLSMPMDMSAPSETKITWEDDSSKERQWSTTLTR
jgi:hypothetical protein